MWVTATAIDRDGRLVTDLGRDDFEVLEDGVVQPITVFRSDPVPFALSIMFDLSGSLSDSVGSMRRAMAELIDRFRPGDRANVGSFDTLPTVSPRFSGHRETLLRSTALSVSPTGLSSSTTGHAAMPCHGPWNAELWRQQARGMSAVWDGVACGIDTVAGDAETPRRVVLLITDGVDHVSVTRQAEVHELADKFGVMVYVIAMIGTEGLNSGGLRSLAAETGGGYFVLNQQADLTPTFTRIAEELRHQYVMGYSATAGSGPAGRLEVRVKRPGITARGRRATMTVLPVATAVTEAVEAERRRTATVAAPASVVVSDSVFDRAARNELRPADLPPLSLEGMRIAALEIRTAGPLWIRAGGPALEPARRLHLAILVLQLLSVQDNLLHWNSSEAAADLFDWTSSLMRTGPPQPMERLWHLAAVAMLEKSGAFWVLNRHVEIARARFPDEARFVLARAVAAEQPIWPQRRDEFGFVLREDDQIRIFARYNEAFRVEAIRQEAHLRLGYIEMQRGRVKEALTHFEQAGAPEDAVLRYTLHLFRGQALGRAKRHEEAIASFRQAIAIAPHTESATLALAAALVTKGQHAEAEALVGRMFTVQPRPFDPWTIHTFPEWRHWAIWMDALRKAAGS